VSSSDLDEATARLERLSPGYLEQVRRAARRLSVSQTPGERLADALDQVEASARIDAGPHQTTGGPVTRSLQRLIRRQRMARRLLRWYLLQVSGQVTEFSYAVTSLGYALRDYVDEMEHQVEQLRSEIAELRARLPKSESGPTGDS
jgi:hypothetical protein